MSEEPLILAIETARREWTISLLKGLQEISCGAGDSLLSSSEMLLRMISSFLKESSVSLKELDAIAVSRGPGSFTGIRVGLATAQALAFGTKINCCGISLFDAMILMFQGFEEKVLTAVAAGREHVYWQSFSFLNDHFEKDFVPVVDNYVDFAAQVNKWREENREVGILVDDELNYTLEKSEIFDIRHIRQKFQVGSDNVAKYIGFKCREIISRNNLDAEWGNDLTPLYIREIRIGK